MTHKRVGFLSFGHWQPIPGSQVRTAQDALVQTVELAVAAEELGLDGAFVRVHHFARQLAAPFPLLTAIAMRTSRIEIGTGVIDMRYENPLYMAEEAAAADLLSGGRLQLGVSRGSPETALNGSRAFGYVPSDGADDGAMAREHTALFRAAIAGAAVGDAKPALTGVAGRPPAQPPAPGPPDRVGYARRGDGGGRAGRPARRARAGLATATAAPAVAARKRAVCSRAMGPSSAPSDGT